VDPGGTELAGVSYCNGPAYSSSLLLFRRRLLRMLSGDEDEEADVDGDQSQDEDEDEGEDMMVVSEE
jgi:hypothetical protein